MGLFNYLHTATEHIHQFFCASGHLEISSSSPKTISSNYRNIAIQTLGQSLRISEIFFHHCRVYQSLDIYSTGIEVRNILHFHVPGHALRPKHPTTLSPSPSFHLAQYNSNSRLPSSEIREFHRPRKLRTLLAIGQVGETSSPSSPTFGRIPFALNVGHIGRFFYETSVILQRSCSFDRRRFSRSINPSLHRHLRWTIPPSTGAKLDGSQKDSSVRGLRRGGQ